MLASVEGKLLRTRTDSLENWYASSLHKEENLMEVFIQCCTEKYQTMQMPCWNNNSKSSKIVPLKHIHNKLCNKIFHNNFKEMLLSCMKWRCSNKHCLPGLLCHHIVYLMVVVLGNRLTVLQSLQNMARLLFSQNFVVTFNSDRNQFWIFEYERSHFLTI